jgi:hypothetical protein
VGGLISGSAGTSPFSGGYLGGVREGAGGPDATRVPRGGELAVEGSGVRPPVPVVAGHDREVGPLLPHPEGHPGACPGVCPGFARCLPGVWVRVSRV